VGSVQVRLYAGFRSDDLRYRASIHAVLAIVHFLAGFLLSFVRFFGHSFFSVHTMTLELERVAVIVLSLFSSGS